MSLKPRVSVEELCLRVVSRPTVSFAGMLQSMRDSVQPHDCPEVPVVLKAVKFYVLSTM